VYEWALWLRPGDTGKVFLTFKYFFSVCNVITPSSLGDWAGMNTDIAESQWPWRAGQSVAQTQPPLAPYAAQPTPNCEDTPRVPQNWGEKTHRWFKRTFPHESRTRLSVRNGLPGEDPETCPRCTLNPLLQSVTLTRTGCYTTVRAAVTRSARGFGMSGKNLCTCAARLLHCLPDLQLGISSPIHDSFLGFPPTGLLSR
jgi:hypothetical protein